MTTEFGSIFVLDMVLESTKGLVRLDKLSLNGWMFG